MLWHGSGGGFEGALVALGVVEADVADGVAGGGVAGDAVVVADGGDGLPGAVVADVDVEVAELDAAVGADGEGVDGGVVLAGQVAGAAVAAGGVPGLLGCGADRGVVAVGVVVLPVLVQQRLQPGRGGWGGAGGQPAFESLVVAFGFAAGLRVVGAGVDEPGAQARDRAGERAGPRAAGTGTAGERGAVEFLSGVKSAGWS